MKVIITRYRAKLHPYLDILCDSLGRIFVPENHGYKAHWTFGSMNKHTGYRYVGIAGKRYLVSRLICETFHGLAPEDRPTCDHINRNKDWNTPENLRWANYKTQLRNRQVCYDSLARYGVRVSDDPAAYQRARYAADPEHAEQKRAKAREWYANSPEHAEQKRAKAREYNAKNAERHRTLVREWQAKQRELGRKCRRCPDSKQHWLTDEEYDARFGINRQLPLF